MTKTLQNSYSINKLNTITFSQDKNPDIYKLFLIQIYLTDIMTHQIIQGKLKHNSLSWNNYTQYTVVFIDIDINLHNKHKQKNIVNEYLHPVYTECIV